MKGNYDKKFKWQIEMPKCNVHVTNEFLIQVSLTMYLGMMYIDSYLIWDEYIGKLSLQISAKKGI